MYTYLFVDSKSQHILHVEVCSGAQIAEKKPILQFRDIPEKFLKPNRHHPDQQQNSITLH